MTAAALAAVAAAGGSRERLGGVRDRGLAVHGGRRPAVAQRRRLQRRRAPRRGDDQRDELRRVGVPAPGRRRLRAGGGLADRGRRRSGPSGAAVGDYNGDGRADLAVSSFVAGNVSVLLRQPGGGFALEGGAAIPLGTRISAVAAGDFNSDGRLDLAATQNDGNQVVLLLRNAQNTGFSAQPPFATGAEPGRDRRRRLQRRRAGRPGDRQPGRRQRDDPAAGSRRHVQLRGGGPGRRRSHRHRRRRLRRQRPRRSRGHQRRPRHRLRLPAPAVQRRLHRGAADLGQRLAGRHRRRRLRPRRPARPRRGRERRRRRDPPPQRRRRLHARPADPARRRRQRRRGGRLRRRLAARPGRVVVHQRRGRYVQRAAEPGARAGRRCRRRSPARPSTSSRCPAR